VRRAAEHCARKHRALALRQPQCAKAHEWRCLRLDSHLLTLFPSDILKRGLGLKEAEIGDIFDKWNSGVLDSFLIEM
jgi:hypothetical protein